MGKAEHAEKEAAALMQGGEASIQDHIITLALNLSASTDFYQSLIRRCSFDPTFGPSCDPSRDPSWDPGRGPSCDPSCDYSRGPGCNPSCVQELEAHLQEAQGEILKYEQDRERLEQDLTPTPTATPKTVPTPTATPATTHA